jgi:transcriptional regulator with XRE-family HTH domain
LRFQELGAAVRSARVARGITQAALALDAGLSRATLNRLENGVFPDLGLRKVQTLLEKLGMEISVKPARRERSMDFVSMACTTASVSFRQELTPDELVHALLSGKAPAAREAHFIALLEEAPVPLLKGLVAQVGAWVKPGKVSRNLEKIAKQVGLAGEGNWRKIA